MSAPRLSLNPSHGPALLEASSAPVMSPPLGPITRTLGFLIDLYRSCLLMLVFCLGNSPWPGVGLLPDAGHRLLWTERAPTIYVLKP